jgi:hypothetical protein
VEERRLADPGRDEHLDARIAGLSQVPWDDPVGLVDARMVQVLSLRELSFVL